jgi:hypothetical protein
MLYLLAGLLIVLHAEQEVFELFKNSFSPDLMPAIAGVFSAIAAFMSWSASNKAAEAAEKSNIIALLPDRIRTRDALSSIWNYLNRKSCICSYNPMSPHDFLVTSDEIENIKAQKEAIYCSSASYGELFQSSVIEFYAYMKSELEAQGFPCDFEGGEITLLPETQKKYRLSREREREKAFVLLQQSVSLMHRKP